MAITMQGAWTISVKAKNAAFAQRFVVSGAAIGNGPHDGTPGNSVFVSGSQWSVNIQSQASGQPWFDSAQRITFPTVSAGLLHFDINSDDTGGDKDYNDLVLTCSMPISASEFVVYGNVKTYSGFCRFNPCYPWYLVIETAAQLVDALANPRLRDIIKKLYPERVPRKPGPPDPGPLTPPLVLPMGNPVESSGLVFRSTAAKLLPPEGEVRRETEAKKYNEASAAKLKASAQPVVFDGAPASAGSALLDRLDLLEVSKIHDISRYLYCNVQPAAGLLLAFQEYDRTSAEKAGGPYTGTGVREALGLAATDELGNYLFRFSRSFADVLGEISDAAPGEVLATQIFPDVIVQTIGTGMAVDYETAPYYNIPNLKRIDLCIPWGRVHPNQGCSGDRVMQRIGDIIVLNSALGGHPNTLDGDGRITCRNANAPQVDCAAWRGGLRLYACLGTQVTSYTVRYWRIDIDTDWQFVDEVFRLNHIPDFAPGYIGTYVGSTPRAVRVDGGGPVTRPTYENHEGDSNWIENDLKLILSSGLYRPVDSPGSVDFRIQGYDSAGNAVAGKTDTIRLFIDNRAATGDIESITMGTTTLGDCGLFELTSPNAPLTVRYRALDPEGFLASWSLSVTRGNNVAVPVSVTSGVTPKSYTLPSGSCTPFRGTADESTADSSGYVDTTLQPSGGANWLPADHNFCAFAFTLSADDRVTDGRSGYPRAFTWEDLIGLSAT